MTEVIEESLEMHGFHVHGKVQGVGFRWWTRRVALRLGLCGLVRNLPSGVVEVHAGGAPADLKQFEFALAAGPPMAQVSKVEVVQPDESISWDRFLIEKK